MSTQAAMFLCPSKFSIGELHNALVAGRDLLAGGWRVQCMVSRRNLDYTKSVSYTHLTLPTIYSV